jgi:hypothetical protein
MDSEVDSGLDAFEKSLNDAIEKSPTTTRRSDEKRAASPMLRSSGRSPIHSRAGTPLQRKTPLNSPALSRPVVTPPPLDDSDDGNDDVLEALAACEIPTTQIESTLVPANDSLFDTTLEQPRIMDTDNSDLFARGALSGFLFKLGEKGIVQVNQASGIRKRWFYIDSSYDGKLFYGMILYWVGWLCHCC